MKSDLFQSCGHCWVFQICWHIECSTFTASDACRIWNSYAGIPSPPLALFVVMLSKAHLTSHSRMSGSRWVITPSWLSGSWRSFFVQFFRVFLPPLLNIFKKIRDTKGIFHAKMSSIKDRNGTDLWEAEDIKKRWQEYTEELYKKDNHDGVITHLGQTSWNEKSSRP